MGFLLENISGRTKRCASSREKNSEGCPIRERELINGSHRKV